MHTKDVEVIQIKTDSFAEFQQEIVKISTKANNVILVIAAIVISKPCPDDEK